MFWWIYSIIFIVAAVVKMNDTYFIVAALFAVAASLSDIGWKLRNFINKFDAWTLEEEEPED